MSKNNKLGYIEWDMKTLTIDDFTVKLEITDNLWEEFNKRKTEILRSKNNSQKFEEFLKKELFQLAKDCSDD